MAVVVLSLVAFLYSAYDCLQLYMKESSRVVNGGSATSRLPSITVCNVNQLRSAAFFWYNVYVCAARCTGH